MIPIVTKGACAGFLVRVAGGVEAYGADEKLVGTFADPIAAAVAIESASATTGKGHHTKILGVDPGVRGGLAVVAIDDGAAPRLIEAIDIPVVGTGAKERVDAIAIRAWIASHKPDHAYVERAQARPGQGASSGFKYGRAVGAIEAAIALSGTPMTVVEPSAWKKFHQLRGGEKEASRQRALQLFPEAHALLGRRKDHGRGEAALLALYGAQQ
jgi:crossover junction endodeoxyribonuclease RuvC